MVSCTSAATDMDAEPAEHAAAEPTRRIRSHRTCLGGACEMSRLVWHLRRLTVTLPILTKRRCTTTFSSIWRARHWTTARAIKRGLRLALPVAVAGTYNDAVGAPLVLDGQHGQAVVIFAWGRVRQIESRACP